jgi:hypothetical protein
MLIWSKCDQSAVASAAAGIEICLVEFPRLRLTFSRREAAFYCQELPGFHLTDSTNVEEISLLVEKFPNAVLLKNDFNEYMIVMAAIAKPRQYRIRKKSSVFRLVFDYTDLEWCANCGEVTYFSYPIHISNAQLQCKSIAAVFYLLNVYLMTQNYKDAFQLISTCVCDRPLNRQESQIYEITQTLRDKLLVDSAACRLKLFFVTYGCREHMKYLYNIEEDLELYVQQIQNVSSECRLSPNEELFEKIKSAP